MYKKYLKLIYISIIIAFFNALISMVIGNGSISSFYFVLIASILIGIQLCIYTYLDAVYLINILRIKFRYTFNIPLDGMMVTSFKVYPAFHIKSRTNFELNVIRC